MLVTDEQSHVTHAVIGGGQTMDFGISNNAEFFQILSSSLYSDQILAVVREVLCNAWDAHIEANKTDVPLTVSLADGQLVVRDYGLGIPHDLIQPIYGVYGQSTKRLDGKATGGFGLGCKAPFAYKDHFEVTSWNQGVKTIYALSRSSSEANGKPGITPIVSMPTEESGLQVKIAVDPADRAKFISKIKKIIEDGEMLVMFDFGNNISEPALAQVIKYSNAKLGFTLRLFSENTYSPNKINVRYGNVIYPVPRNTEYEEQFDTVRGIMNNTFSDNVNIVLQAAPNSLTISPSRESVSMQDKAIATIKSLLLNFIHVMTSEYMVQRKRFMVKQVLDESEKNGITFSELVSGRINSYATYRASCLQTVDEIIRYSIRVEKLRIPESLCIKFAGKLVKPEMKGTLQLYKKNKGNRGKWHYRYVFAKVDTLIYKHLAQRDYPITFLSMSYNRIHVSERHGDYYSFYSMKPEDAIQKIVVLTCSVHTMKSRILHWKDTIRSNIVMVQQINRNNPDLEKLRTVLRSRKDITFIDLTVKYEWEIKERDTVVEAKPKGIVRLDQLLEGHTPAKPLVDAEYITKPKFVVHMPRSDNRLVTRFSNHFLDKIIKKFGEYGGICTTTPSIASYLSKKGVQQLDDFLIDHMHAHLVRSKKVRRHHSTHKASSLEYTINDAILADEKLSKEMGIYTELSEDDKFYYQMYRFFELSTNPKVVEIQEFFSKAKPLPFFGKVRRLFSENVIFKYMDTKKVYSLLKSHDTEEKSEIVSLLKTHLKD